MKLNVEYLPVDHLTPYAKNARTHSEDQVAQIAGSMTEFGFVNPIETPEFLSEPVEGAPTIRGAVIPIILEYSTSNPLQ